MRSDDQALSTQKILEAVAAIEPEIRAAAANIEAERKLPPALAHRLMESGAFRMGVPEAYNGPAIDPMGQVRVVEELSRIEGSVGWLSMISSAGSFIAAFLEPAVAQRMFGSIESVLAGQIRPPQRADLVEGGYRLTGRFHFASGCEHSSVFVCGSVIYENGQPRVHGRNPEFRALLVPRSKVSLIDVWDTTGMRGTGSNDFAVEDVFVPFSDSTTMQKPVTPGPLYVFPPLFLVSHAGVPLGIARSALDFVTELSMRKPLSMPGGKLLRDDPVVQEAIAWAEAHLGAARSYVYATLQDLWATLSVG